MSHIPHYIHGEWLADCDSCGKTYHASSLKKRWDGLMVCDKDWEPRQPQDFVKAILDTQAVSWTRPEPTDIFVPGSPNLSQYYSFTFSVVPQVNQPMFVTSLYGYLILLGEGDGTTRIFNSPLYTPLMVPPKVYTSSGIGVFEIGESAIGTPLTLLSSPLDYMYTIIT